MVSLNSLVDYPLSESDIEDSDDEAKSKDSEGKPIVLSRPYIAQARVIHSKLNFVSCFCQRFAFDNIKAKRQRSRTNISYKWERYIYSTRKKNLEFTQY